MKNALEDIFEVLCYDSGGNLKWVDTIHNLVVNEGLNDSLDKYFRGSSFTASHYCGLTTGTPIFNATDVLSSHIGWTEITEYNELVRQIVSWGTVSDQSIDNNTNRAVYSINATITIGGAFICTNSVKGGTSGILYGGGVFVGGDKILNNGDILSVKVTALNQAI